MTIRGAARGLQAWLRSTRSDVLACSESAVNAVPESDYQGEIAVATELARAAGTVLLKHYYSPFLVEQKVNALDELEEVTAADREANELIVTRLKKEFPDDGILAEGSTDTEHHTRRNRACLITPTDETHN